MHELRAVLLLFVVFAMDKTEARPANEVPPLLYFKDGLFGVNFLGFHAAAGLKSLQDGAGLHAEAGTPFGQSAAAGLAGGFKSDGALGGQLYAGATAGGNVKAAAGLGGGLQDGKAAGTLYSAASAGSARAGSVTMGGVSDEGSVKIVEKVADAAPRKPRISKRTYVTVAEDSPPQSNNGGGFLTSFFAPPPVATVSKDSTVQVMKSGTFFDDIFNIPISTLGAVSRFLSNTVPAKPATVEVQKTITTH